MGVDCRESNKSLFLWTEIASLSASSFIVGSEWPVPTNCGGLSMDENYRERVGETQCKYTMFLNLKL